MSDKLREAIERAERESLPNKAKEKMKKDAKKVAAYGANKAKKKAVQKTAQGTKKLAKGAHKLLSAKSKTYAKATKAIARGLSALKNTKVAAMAAKVAGLISKIITFLVTPILGWVVSVILILLIVVVLFSGGDDDTDDTIDDVIVTTDEVDGIEDVEWSFSSQETEELYHYYLEEDVCPPITYSPVISDESYASGEWTEEGSTAYNNAKLIFDTWVDAGLSGAAAAGIVGWVNSEGGFHMFGRAEGHYASNNPEEASLAYGNLPVVSRPTYPTGSNGEQQGGGGVYQFTPYDKYAPLGSPDWEDPVKMHDYLFSVFRDELTSSAWIPQGGNDMTGEETSFEDFAQETDPERATLMWNAYERANQADVDPEQKKSDARFAYEAFGGADYTFDAERFEATFGERAEDYVHTARAASYDPCHPSVRGGGSWRGAGGQPTITSGMWTHPRSSAIGRESIPDELREYALDPESVGLIFGDGMSWINKWKAGSSDGGQCTHLTSNLAELLWEKDGVPIHNKAGNGRAVVGNFAAKYGADGESTTPTGGAIFSTSEGSAYCGEQKCGHTGIVSHVFDNGDFLVIETNMGGYSGDAIGRPYTYSYRYISRQKAIDGEFTFYDPSKVGFKLVPGIKSL